MKVIFSTLGLLLLLTIATSVQATPRLLSSATDDVAFSTVTYSNFLMALPGNGNGNCGNGVNHQTVHAILKYCADYWSVTYGYLRSEYAQGDLTITPVLYSTGAPAFDVASATKGIVCVLESNL